MFLLLLSNQIYGWIIKVKGQSCNVKQFMTYRNCPLVDICMFYSDVDQATDDK